MLKHNALKKSENGLPTWDSLIPIVLHFALQRDNWKNRELKISVADSLDLPKELRSLMYEKTKQTLPSIENRAGWALSCLKLAGLIEYPQRGICAVTPFGRELYSKYGKELNEKILKAQPKFLEHKKLLGERKKRDNSLDNFDEIDITVSEDIEETIFDHVQSYNQVVATELLDKIIQSEPIFFEHLVKELLVAMGYKGGHGNAIVTTASRDGGIDGIINQDPLGTSTVYFQAKRYGHGNSVQRQDIEAFFGALSRIRANRGVFITTSRFSKTAEETAKGFSIVLIDGLMLTDLMLQYNVGVKIKKNYVLYDIDEDFFEEL